MCLLFIFFNTKKNKTKTNNKTEKKTDKKRTINIVDEMDPLEPLKDISKVDFKKMNISYSRPNYIEGPHKKKPSPATAEFSTTVKCDIGEKNITIGEFQFHKSSRTEVKFRFSKSFFY